VIGSERTAHPEDIDRPDAIAPCKKGSNPRWAFTGASPVNAERQTP